MERIRVEIEGTTPILMNRFTDENAQAVSGGTTTTFAPSGSKGTPREQATKKLYTDEKGVLHIPGPNLFRAVIDAGTFHKAGKSKVTTQKSSLVPAAMGIIELTIPVLNPAGGAVQWEVDSRAVVIPSTGGRVMAHRPRIDRWKLAFTVEYDPTMFSPSLVRALIDDAGRRVGLGDFRPARKGPFGKFNVVGWVEEKSAKRAA